MRISQVLAALTVLLSVAAASPWFYPIKEQNKAAQQQEAKEQSDELLKSVMQYLKSGAETENADPNPSPEYGMKQQKSVAPSEPPNAAKQQEESEFQQVYSLDMTDSAQNCPKGFKLNTYGTRRLCGREVDGSSCASIAIPVNGQRYTEVRGRVIGYQYASTDAFLSGGTNIDGVYVDGVSITHGESPRKHVWTLGAGLNSYANSASSCPGTGYGHPQPAFVANNYFCTSGNSAANGWEIKLYDIPLWSTITGNCGHCNSRYEVPYFCTQLPESTSEDLEVRVCANQGLGDEDIQVEAIELFIK